MITIVRTTPVIGVRPWCAGTGADSLVTFGFHCLQKVFREL
jgi:hypothetical protein